MALHVRAGLETPNSAQTRTINRIPFLLGFIIRGFIWDIPTSLFLLMCLLGPSTLKPEPSFSEPPKGAGSRVGKALGHATAAGVHAAAVPGPFGLDSEISGWGGFKFKVNLGI